MHTPGPWERDGTTVYKLNGVPIEGAPKGWNLWTARVMLSDAKRCSPEEVEANARLIAAAPDLLAVLERYVEADSGPELEDSLHVDAVAAIAKARGQ
jgi:hypothetical protein